MSREELRVFFEPRSVAIVGASRNPDKFGSIILTNLLNWGFEGKLFPINPYASEVCGLKSFPSLREVKEEVELVISAVPSFAVPQVIEECGQNGIKGVIIIASGFAETGEEGVRRQQQLVASARRSGIRVIGPNTTGTLNPGAKFTSTFNLMAPAKEGPVAFIAQTGMFAGVMLSWILTTEPFGISKVAGLGNQSDVSAAEVLDYLGRDEATRVVMMYLEGMREGRRFFEVARQVAKKKPILLVKGGRTEAGARMALSHTGSLAGRADILDGALKQAGVIPARDLEEMLDFAKALALQPPPQGPHTAIISMSGGNAVMASDACIEAGLTLAQLSPQVLGNIQKHLPPWAKAGHPIDLEPLSERVGRAQAYCMALELALADPGVDGCLVSISALGPEEKSLPQLFAPLCQAQTKPVVIHIMSNKEFYEELSQSFAQLALPTYPIVSRAARSLACLYWRRSRV